MPGSSSRPQRRADARAEAASARRARQPIIYRPQEGPQTQFFESPADIVIYGGGAGGGKTWGLLGECARYAAINKDFGAVIFRRSYPEIRNEGGLWDESEKLYDKLGATATKNRLEWVFPIGGRVQFRHLQHEQSVKDYQGAQIPLIAFDELTHFSQRTFFYMLSRNRSMCGVRPYIRATCNPDADSWVREFIDWWIDKDSGLAIPERSGVIRWFIRRSGAIIWGASRRELIDKYEPPHASEQDRVRPKSVTFIPASVYDNKILLRENPDYLATLQALDLVERARLLEQNWNIRHTAGLVFNRDDLLVVRPEELPYKFMGAVRAWDKAATQSAGDWSVGVLMALGVDTLVYILDVRRTQLGTGKREILIRETAARDAKLPWTGASTRTIWLEQEPGSGGKDSAVMTIANLTGYAARAQTSTGSKVERAQPFAAAVQNHRVRLLAGDWNKPYTEILHGFPDIDHDDDVDASALAYSKLTAAAALAHPEAWGTVRG